MIIHLNRFLKENMILCGLWFGESKAIYEYFYKTAYEISQNFSTCKCWNFQYEVENEKICTKGFLICGTADLPAKSEILNCNQFNGQFSCMSCLHPGEHNEHKKEEAFTSVHILHLCLNTKRE